MSRKSKIAALSQALEEAARVATTGDIAERSGQFAHVDEPSDDTQGTTGDEVVMYRTERGVEVDLRYRGDKLWMTQADMAQLFGVTVATISRHLRNIFAEGELDPDAVVTKIVTTASDGKDYTTAHYALDAIISVGYRVSSKQATLFRIWATDKLVQYAVKGFAVDDERLKSVGGNDYFSELRERIRDIRASEANVYKEVHSICALCSDYDQKAPSSRNFFAGMQNRLLWAVTTMTAPQIIVDRADATRPNMGLATWQGRQVSKADVIVSKNYLGEVEIRELNRITNMLLDYFDDRTERRRVTTMADLEGALVDFLKFNQRPVLQGLGDVKREKAEQHARSEYDKYSEMRRLARQSEGEKSVSALIAIGKSKTKKAKR